MFEPQRATEESYYLIMMPLKIYDFDYLYITNMAKKFLKNKMQLK
jgi:hypothetical protein